MGRVAPARERGSLEGLACEGEGRMRAGSAEEEAGAGEGLQGQQRRGRSFLWARRGRGRVDPGTQRGRRLQEGDAPRWELWPRVEEQVGVQPHSRRESRGDRGAALSCLPSRLSPGAPAGRTQARAGGPGGRVDAARSTHFRAGRRVGSGGHGTWEGPGHVQRDPLASLSWGLRPPRVAS